MLKNKIIEISNSEEFDGLSPRIYEFLIKSPSSMHLFQESKVFSLGFRFGITKFANLKESTKQEIFIDIWIPLNARHFH